MTLQFARPSLEMRHVTARGLDKAVHHSTTLSPSWLREKLFTTLFRGLVYPQIWEDPVIDMEALDIQSGNHLVAIASGGCNVLSYLTADPGRITAVDLNHTHIALNRMKLAAARHLPSYWHFANFFAHADLPSNVQVFDEYLADHLDDNARSYWEGRDILGRRRINAFARGFYHTGLLGTFIGACHALGKALGLDMSTLVKATSLQEQRQFFDVKMAPLFDHWLLRWILSHPASLYGLGIPPAQYTALAGGRNMHMVLRERVEKLACGFPMKDNYFARQAFGRSYDVAANGLLPPYLQAQHFDVIRARAERVDVRHQSMTEFLAREPAQTVDAFVLLDAQDWMNTAQISDLWRQIDHSAAPGARVIFRTAADERLLPGRVPDDILSHWTFHEARSRDLNARDRSSIYGGFHLYTRNA